MADLEFVDPSTGAALGEHAFGVIPAGTVSAAFAARLRYKWGQSGSGIPANALCLRLSEDGGATWRTDLRQFTVVITAVVNGPLDPLYTETVRNLGKGSRFRLAPLRAGCAVDFAITFTPDLRPGGGASTTGYRWEAGLDFEQWEEIALIPGAPSGILTGLGDATAIEWVTAPTLTNGIDKVTLGVGTLVNHGVYMGTASGDVALDQNDGDSAALAAGQEYVAVGAVYTDGSIVVMKGSKAAAGAALQPASYTDVPVFVARVPYGGVIVTSTLLAVSGRCLVTDAGGLVVTVQPGRAVSPGMLAMPATVQTLTLADNTTSTVYLSPSGVANVTAGIPLAEVTTASGDITVLTDIRRILRPEPLRLKMPGVEAVAANVDRAYVPYSWTCDRAAARVMTPAAGAGDYTDVEVLFDGGRLAWLGIVAGAAGVEATLVEIKNGAAGWITVSGANITTGGTPAADIEVLLWIVQTA